MKAKFAKVSAALFFAAVSANQAMASCFPWDPPCTGGSSVPEIDGSAGIMVMALVASVAGLLYNRARK